MLFVVLTTVFKKKDNECKCDWNGNNNDNLNCCRVKEMGYYYYPIQDIMIKWKILLKAFNKFFVVLTIIDQQKL
jgi:hypothetical protein